MNWVDLAVLGVILVSGLFGLLRGLVREALGVGAWLLAAAAASPYGALPYAQPIARQHIADPAIADAVAFGVVFLVVLVILLLIVGWISRAVHASALGGLDRSLGLLFGMARGAFLVCLTYILAGMAIAMEQWPPQVIEARSLPFVYRGAAWLREELPKGYQPLVAPPPGAKPATAADLLRAAPLGRAIDQKLGKN